MASIEDRLMSIKRRLDEARSKRDQAQGAINQLMARLEKEFKVTDLTSAQELLDDLLAEQSQLEKDIQIQLDKLENDYEWN